MKILSMLSWSCGSPKWTSSWKFTKAGSFGAYSETPSAIRTHPDGVSRQCMCGVTSAAAGALVANTKPIAATAATALPTIFRPTMFMIPPTMEHTFAGRVPASTTLQTWALLPTAPFPNTCSRKVHARYGIALQQEGWVVQDHITGRTVTRPATSEKTQRTVAEWNAGASPDKVRTAGSRSDGWGPPRGPE